MRINKIILSSVIFLSVIFFAVANGEKESFAIDMTKQNYIRAYMRNTEKEEPEDKFQGENIPVSFEMQIKADSFQNIKEELVQDYQEENEAEAKQSQKEFDQNECVKEAQRDYIEESLVAEENRIASLSNIIEQEQWIESAIIEEEEEREAIRAKWSLLSEGKMEDFDKEMKDIEAVTKKDIMVIAKEYFGVSEDWTKMLIGTTEREGYTSGDPYLSYAWACEMINVYKNRTVQDVYTIMEKWSGNNYYSEENVLKGYEQASRDTLKCIMLAMTKRNTKICEVDGMIDINNPPSSYKLLYDSKIYNCQVWAKKQ